MRILRSAPRWSTLLALAGCSLPDINVENPWPKGGDSDTNDSATQEPCDGVDNNRNGAVDEGHPDTDGDGVADCVDEETCDGVDNDGDGAIDEGYPDADGDELPDCLDAEECDGLDNNGDGEIDEGFDANANDVPDCLEFEYCNCTDDDGDGEVDEGCTYTLSITTATDDYGDHYLDDAVWFSSAGWNSIVTRTTTIDAGVHHIATFIRDNGSQARHAGLRAHVLLDGDLIARTGDGDFYGVAAGFGGGWRTSTAGMLPDNTFACNTQYSGYWSPQPIFDATGADWVWFDNCRRADLYPMNRFVLEFEVCGELDIPEACDGEDNDRDGATDEGFPDTDLDGVADCIDAEECDGLDNDGNGFIDEYFPDTDGDGLCDGMDFEDCDGVDNDGDGSIDELYPDTDGNGVADCVEPELCDGIDNNVDGFIDEDYPDTDADGIADCMDAEECDGLDNDGDRLVDEGTADTDGDGLCDDLDSEDCDGLDNDGNGVVDDGFPDVDANGVADCMDPELDCDCRDNNGNGLIDEDCEYELSLVATADDRLRVSLDGSPWVSGLHWTSPVTGTTVINGGTHHLAAYAWDLYGVYAGYRAEVSVDGALVSATGDGSWLGSATYPGAGWETSTAGLGAELVQSCAWGALSDFTGGSDWIWPGACTDPTRVPEGWFVLAFDVCGPERKVELCNGVDDDRDGLIDEDYADTDGDGTADCVDTEECFDLLDNDGDGEIDEDCYGDCGAVDRGFVTCTIASDLTLSCDLSSRVLPITAWERSTTTTPYTHTWQVDMSAYRTMIVDAPVARVSQWGLHIANSQTNDGFGGDAGTTWHDSEFNTFGTDIALYADDFGSSAALLSQAAAIHPVRDRLRAVVCDGYLGFESDVLGYTDVSSPTIFQIDGDESDPGSSTGLNDQTLWLGFNRVVGTSARRGQGLSDVTVYLIP